MDLAALLPIFQILTLVSIIVLTLYGVVLGFHWYSYGEKTGSATTLMIIYVTGSVLCIIGMALSLMLF